MALRRSSRLGRPRGQDDLISESSMDDEELVPKPPSFSKGTRVRRQSTFTFGDYTALSESMRRGSTSRGNPMMIRRRRSVVRRDLRGASGGLDLQEALAAPATAEIAPLPPELLSELETNLIPKRADEGEKRSQADELWRAFTAASVSYPSPLHEGLTLPEFKQFLADVGWASLPDDRATTLLGAQGPLFGFASFAQALLHLSFLATPTQDPSDALSALTDLVDKAILPYLQQKVDLRYRCDVRSKASIDDILFVYHNVLQDKFVAYRAQKHHMEYSQRMASVLDTMVEQDEWMQFCDDYGVSKVLYKGEMARIPKISQFNDKEHLIDYRVPSDQSFAGSVCLDLAEFMNAVVWTALAIFRNDPNLRVPESKVLAFLNYLNSAKPSKAKRMREPLGTPNLPLLYDIPPAPTLTRVTPCEGDVEGGYQVVVEASPLCHRRGVYYKVGPSPCTKVDNVSEGAGSITLTVPPFPSNLRFIAPSESDVASRREWVAARRRQLDRLQYLKESDLSPRVSRKTSEGLPPRAPQPMNTFLLIEPTQEGGALSLKVKYKYVVDISLSNEGREYSGHEGNVSSFTYTDSSDPLRPVPPPLIQRLSGLFKRYCQHEDSYNHTLMTSAKWGLFKRDFHVVEPALAIYRAPFSRPKAAPRRSNVPPEFYSISVSRLPDRRPSASEMLFEKSMSEGQAGARKQEFAVEEPSQPPTDSPLFLELAQVTQLHSQPVRGVTFPWFVALLARVVADLYGVVDPWEYIEELLDGGKCTLPRAKKVPGLGEVVEAIGMEKLIASYPVRPFRQYDVFYGALLVGVLSEGFGVVDDEATGTKIRNSVMGYRTYLPGHPVNRHVARVARMEVHSFVAAIPRLMGAGMQFAPSGDPATRRPIMRCYEVTVATTRVMGNRILRALRSACEVSDHVVVHDARAAAVGDVFSGTTLAAHLWDYPGSIASPWWQAADGEIAHPEATMMVYGEDPTLHFHRMFSFFTTTRTLPELRKALEGAGYELALVAWSTLENRHRM